MSLPDINQLKEKLNELQSPGQLSQFNSFIQKATDTLMCNTECQKIKMGEILKKKLMNAQINLYSAPNQLQLAQKNFVTFTRGEPAYNELLEYQLEQKANLIAEQFLENFIKEANNFNTQIETYSGIVIHFKNIIDLYFTYKKENIKLSKELKEETNDTLTNQRKTYYEDQQIDFLKYYYYYILFTIYIVVVICFIIFSLVYPSNKSIFARIFMVIGFILLPYISPYILAAIIYIAYRVYEFLPKNVYLNP